MKEYVYLWIDEYIPLDDLGGSKCLFDNVDLCFSSKYEIKAKKEKGKHILNIEEKKNTIPENYFSDDIVGIKAFVGSNGSGKSSLMKLFYRIISQGWGCEDQCNFILVYKEDDEFFCFGNGIEIGQIEISIQLKNGTKKRGMVVDWKENYAAAKSSCSVFYTGSVNDARIAMTYDDKCFDLSTNALLYSDMETFFGNINDEEKRKNLLESDYKYYHGELEKNRDHFSTYVLMEMIRKISFASIFFEKFKNKEFFRIPNLIVVAPSFYDVKLSLSDIAEIDRNFSMMLSDIEYDIKHDDDIYEWIKYSAFLNRMRQLCLSTEKNIPKELFKKLRKTENKTLDEFFLILKNNGDVFFAQKTETLIEKLRELSSDEKQIVKKIRKYRTNFKNIEGFYFDLKKRNHQRCLRDVISLYQDIAPLTPFLTMNCRLQSSGEENVVKFFSRLYFALQGKKYGQEGIHLFIDEADLYLHPEWQRCWLKNFLAVMKVVLKKIYPSGGRPKIQLFLTTHSPFIITDLFNENITLLDRKNYGPVKVINNHSISPFGGNLYDFLDADGAFFLENSIGAFAEEKIRKASEKLSDKDPEIEFTRRRVGDPIIKCLINEVGLGDD